MAIKFLSDVLGSGELEGITIEATDKITIGGSSNTALTISQGDILLGGAAGTAGQVLTSNGEDNSTSWTDKTVNTNNYVTSATFNSQGNGILTLNRTGLSSVTVSLDGRYAEKVTGGYLPLSGGTMTGQLKILTITSASATSAIGTSSTPIVSIFAESLTASLMTGTLSGTLSSTVVGTTQSLDDGSTRIATTAYVDGMIGTVTDSNTTYQLTTTPTGTGIRLDPSSGLNNDISFTGSGNGITITRNSPTALTFTSSPTLADVMTNGSTTTSAITVGTITNNGSITTTTAATVGTTLTVLGNSSLVSLDVGGGFGSTGATISSAGNVSANGTLTIGSTGTFANNVGIGTTSPALQSGGTGLHINASAHSEIKFTNSTTGTASTDGTALVASGTGFTINNREAGNITLGTSNSTRMTIASDGATTFSGTIDTGANSITTTGTVNAGTFSGDLNGTINTNTTAATQAASNNSTKVATTAYVDAAIGTIPAGLVFQGSWNAATNSPSLSSGSGTTGHFYIVSVAGSTNLDGITDWQVGDWAVFVEQGVTDQWEKIDNSSTLGGAGTSGKIAKWSGTTTLADSTISDNGTDITMSGDLTVSGGDFTLGTSATTSIGKNLLKVPNISAISFIRLNANETVDTLSAADFRTAIGAGTSSTTGTVTGVTGTSPINSDGSSSSPTISIDTADTNTTGALTSTDWNTFNNKTSNTGTVTSTNGSANEIAVFSNTTNINGDANLKYGTVANQLQLVDGTSTIRIGSNTPGYLDIGKNSITHTDGTPSLAFTLSSNRNITFGAPANKSNALTIFEPIADVTYMTLQTTTGDVKFLYEAPVQFNDAVDMQSTATALTPSLADDSTNVATTAFVFANAITGSGVSGRIPYFNGTKSVTSESPLSYDAANNQLELQGQLDFRTSATQTTGIIYEEAPLQDKVSGDIVFLGTAATTQAGRAYILQSNNTWIGVTDNNEARASGMVALALGTNVSDGMLLRGFARFQGGTGYSNYSSITGTLGAKVYVGNSSTHSGAGNMTNTLNTSTNQFVRILGYAVSSNVIYFNPDQSYIQNG